MACKIASIERAARPIGIRNSVVSGFSRTLIGSVRLQPELDR
jgi:hypothetical protein